MRVVPVHYTADVPGMRRFLQALGLAADVASDAGTWVAMTGSGGGVGLHDSAATDTPRRPGEVDLSFEADEPLEAVADRLTAAGFEAEIVDEGWGRSLRTLDPDGTAIQVNEAMTDLHGYSRG